MVRLKHVKSGAVVQVPDEKAERLGAEWVPVETPAPRKPGRPKKSESSE